MLAAVIVLVAMLILFTLICGEVTGVREFGTLLTLLIVATALIVYVVIKSWVTP